MTQSFDEWRDEQRSNIEGYTERDAYKAGQLSRQAEIDCLRIELNGANERAATVLNHKNKMVDKMQAEIDKLQKRIESITETLINHLDYEYDELDCPSYDAMLYALRGIKEILEGETK